MSFTNGTSEPTSLRAARPIPYRHANRYRHHRAPDCRERGMRKRGGASGIAGHHTRPPRDVHGSRRRDDGSHRRLADRNPERRLLRDRVGSRVGRQPCRCRPRLGVSEGGDATQGEGGCRVPPPRRTDPGAATHSGDRRHRRLTGGGHRTGARCWDPRGDLSALRRTVGTRGEDPGGRCAPRSCRRRRRDGTCCRATDR